MLMCWKEAVKQMTQANIEQAEAVVYHGELVQHASERQIEAVLGKPAIEYDDGQKSRTEWDVREDGHTVVVFDHHHYGSITPDQEIDWSVLSDQGGSAVHKGVTGEFVADQHPAPVEQQIAADLNPHT